MPGVLTRRLRMQEAGLKTPGGGVGLPGVELGKRGRG